MRHSVALVDGQEVVHFPNHFDWSYVMRITLVLPLLVMLGCTSRTVPPGPLTMNTNVNGVNVTYLKWKEGLSVLFLDEVAGNRSTGGSGSTDSLDFSVSGSVGAREQGGYHWTLSTKDGKNCKLSINGRNYQLADGAVFVLKSRGTGLELLQLKRDISAVPFDIQECNKYLEDDKELAEHYWQNSPRK